jgi:hypothetical protein
MEWAFLCNRWRGIGGPLRESEKVTFGSQGVFVEAIFREDVVIAAAA